MIPRPIVQRKTAQPRGGAGMEDTWTRVAEGAMRGGEDARVRSHATYALKACGWPVGARARAECLLEDTRTLHHVDDPVNAEFIPEAWTMMPDHVAGSPPMFVAEDCDGLTLRWISLCLAAGLHCKIVGIEYPDGSGHVRGMVWEPLEKQWLEGEPSVQGGKLGHYGDTVARRQERELPNMRITCDDEYCPTDVPPEERDVEHHVSVGAPQEPSSATSVSDEVLENLGGEMTRLAGSLSEAWDELKTVYDAGRSSFAAYGVSSLKDLAPYGWTEEHQQQAIDLGVMVAVASAALRNAAVGERSVWPVTMQNGETSFAIEKKPDDLLAISLDADGNPILVDAAGATYHAPVPDNSVGTHPLLVVGAVGLLYVAVGYVIVRAVSELSAIAKTVTETFLENKIGECLTAEPPCSQEEYERRVEERHKFAIAKIEAETKLAEAQATKSPVDAVASGFNTAIYVGSAVLTLYGLVKLAQELSSKKKRVA